MFVETVAERCLFDFKVISEDVDCGAVELYSILLTGVSFVFVFYYFKECTSVG